jgi:hypothetical protein
MFGVLPFLIQWLTLAQFGSKLFQDQYYGSHWKPPKSHWSLLNDLQTASNDDVELFLPQICNIVLARDISPQYSLHHASQQLTRPVHQSLIGDAHDQHADQLTHIPSRSPFFNMGTGAAHLHSEASARLFDYMENILIRRCEKSLPFGMKLSAMLRVRILLTMPLPPC